MTESERQKARFIRRYCRRPEETAACREYEKKWWPEETAHRIRIADEAAGQRFLFDLPWDMEPTTEPVTFSGEIDWMYQPGDDPEFVYQLNRHRYWVCMGQAYAMTGEERYAEVFVKQLLHWLSRNPINERTKPLTWRTIEAGLRGTNWIRAMSFFAVSPAVTGEVFARFVEGMELHGAYLAACDRPFSVKSNWGVLENSGLYGIGKMLDWIRGGVSSEETEDGGQGRAGCVEADSGGVGSLKAGCVEPDSGALGSLKAGCPDADCGRAGCGYADLAKQRLIRQIRVQVMDDGVHWEQSPMYHNEVLHCCLDVLRTADRSGDAFPEEVTEKVRKMAWADRIWQKPDGNQPSGGDSDRTDLRDVLTACAFVFRSPELKSGAFERLDFESLWDYGSRAAEEYAAIPVCDPADTCFWLRDSGNWYLRSSWKRDGDYLHLRCGGLGGGHGHFDKGHLDLVAGGEEILIDPGRYTYVDGPLRRTLKSARAHNGIMVDGEEYTRCLDSWNVKGLRPALTGNLRQKGIYTLMECGHLGYQDKGICVQRQVLAIGTKIYLVMDTCYGASADSEMSRFSETSGFPEMSGFSEMAGGSETTEPAYSCSQQFHPAPELAVRPEAHGFSAEGKHCRVDIICVSENVTVEQEKFPVSRHYNQLETGEMFRFSRKGKGTVSLITAIICQTGETAGDRKVCVRKLSVESPVSGQVLSENEAEAVEILYGKDRYLVVCGHVEAGSDCEYIGTSGVYGLGRVMAAKNPEPGTDLTVLKW